VKVQLFRELKVDERRLGGRVEQRLHGVTVDRCRDHEP